MDALFVELHARTREFVAAEEASKKREEELRQAEKARRLLEIAPNLHALEDYLRNPDVWQIERSYEGPFVVAYPPEKYLQGLVRDSDRALLWEHFEPLGMRVVWQPNGRLDAYIYFAELEKKAGPPEIHMVDSH
jgi:hypothetical protein